VNRAGRRASLDTLCRRQATASAAAIVHAFAGQGVGAAVLRVQTDGLPGRARRDRTWGYSGRSAAGTRPPIVLQAKIWMIILWETTPSSADQAHLVGFFSLHGSDARADADRRPRRRNRLRCAGAGRRRKPRRGAT
jgi:hypothetical protein